MNLRRRKNENGVRRRLFQSFQKRVERRLGKHMNFVYDIHLIFAHRWRKADFVGEFSDLIDRVVGSRVDFKNIEIRVGSKFDAICALAARRTVGKRRKAVYRTRKNFGNGSLARAARARKNVGVSDVVVRNLVA